MSVYACGGQRRARPQRRGCDALRTGWVLRGPAEVAVVQAADFWNLHDRARRGELDRPEVGCVLVEREMGARLVVIIEVSGQDSTQVSFAENKDVIETLAADRTDQGSRSEPTDQPLARRTEFWRRTPPMKFTRRATLGSNARALWSERFRLEGMVAGYQRVVAQLLQAPAANANGLKTLPLHLRATGAEHAESIVREIVGPEYHLLDAD